MRLTIAVAASLLAGCAHREQKSEIHTSSVTLVEPHPHPAAVIPHLAEEFTLHVIDVGTGLSIFVRGPDFALLYDAGSNDDKATGSDNRVLAYLRAVAPGLKKIDHVLLSHPHQDHVELMADVIRAYEIGAVWDSGASTDICAFRRFLEAVHDSKAGYRTGAHDQGERTEKFPASKCHGHGPDVVVNVSTGPRLVPLQKVDLGKNAVMEFLHVDGSHHTDLNENSLVVRLDLGGARVLLVGDAPGGPRAAPSTAPHKGSAEAALLACCKDGIKADLLVAGHHGSMTSSRSEFIAAVAPKYTVISSGPFPYSQTVLPDKEIEAELASQSELFKTYENDGACGKNPKKIGPDNDGKPGGCSNVQVRIAGGAIQKPSLWVGSD
jgi:competence protein ComEC